MRREGRWVTVDLVKGFATLAGVTRRVLSLIRRRPRSADAVLALAFSAAALASLQVQFEGIRQFDPTFRPSGQVPLGLAMLGVTLPLAWRRRFPLPALVVVVTSFLVGRIGLGNGEASITSLAGSLALYSAALHGRRPFRTPTLVVCVGAISGQLVRELFFMAIPVSLLVKTFTLAYNGVFLVLPWLLGAAIRSLRQRQRELADQAVELQREREENARQAVFRERVRIARELHDVVAHHVSVMGIQAGAARRVMARQPDKAAAALTSIEGSSRQAVAELHHLLGFLRRAGETDELTPQPGLGQLNDLVAESAQAELTVDLTIDGDPRPLPPTLDVSAYRVIQEALTNTRKHSGGAAATVHVHYGPSSLELEVLDDGGGPIDRTGGDHGGHGLIGMRERASLHGGHLRVGPRPEGGFAVHASFPLTEAPL